MIYSRFLFFVSVGADLGVAQGGALRSANPLTYIRDQTHTVPQHCPYFRFSFSDHMSSANQAAGPHWYALVLVPAQSASKKVIVAAVLAFTALLGSSPPGPPSAGLASCGGFGGLVGPPFVFCLFPPVFL